MTPALIVKRRGHEQPFDERKLYGSVYAAALTAHYQEHAAEELASDIVKNVTAWLHEKSVVDSAQLRDHVHALLEKEDKEIAFLYMSHLDIC